MKLDIKKISEILKEKNAMNSCHRCGNKEFSINGYTMFGLQDAPNNVILGGNSIPVVHVICTNCGAITSHAIGALGLLNKEK